MGHGGAAGRARGKLCVGRGAGLLVEQSKPHTRRHALTTGRGVLALAACRYLFVTVAVGLWGGLLIGLQTEYFTSNAYKPVQVRVRAQFRACVRALHGPLAEERGSHTRALAAWSLHVVRRSPSHALVARRTWLTRAARALPPTSSLAWRWATSRASSPPLPSPLPSTWATASPACTALPPPRWACSARSPPVRGARSLRCGA